jgi:eukaryotic-like serine/threonine-protein kinase
MITSSGVFRFGLFEADSASSTLVRGGIRVKIQDQPFRLLLLFLERPGEIVTREELRQKLWTEGTYVDFDGSLNVILKRLRAVLDDDPENPRFIETVPRRGYRFIAPVSVEKTTEKQLPNSTSTPMQPPAVEEGTKSLFPAVHIEADRKRNRRLLIYGASVFAGLAVLVLGLLVFPRGTFAWFGRSSPSPKLTVSVRKSVVVLGFQNLSGRPDDAWLATALSEMLNTELAGGEKLRLIPGEEVANLKSSSPWSQTDSLDPGTTARISSALNSDVLVLGSYFMIGPGEHGQLRLDVRMQDGKTGEILTEAAEVGSTQDLFHLVSRIGSKLRVRLGVEELQGADEAGVLASLPLDPEVARFYAIGVRKLREFDALGAKDLLQHAAQADPRFSMVHSMLARAWAQLGYEQKRREEAKKALDLASDLPRAQRLIVEGEYYESLGKHEQAASAYHALFELFPDNVEYGLLLAGQYTAAGHGTQAMEVIHSLRNLPLSSSSDPRIDLAEARAMKDDKPVALALLRTAVHKASDRGQKLVYAAARKEECMSLLYGEHPDQAAPACEDAYNIFLAAGNRLSAADAVRLMADRAGASGNPRQAIEIYKRALTLLEGLGEHEKTGAVLNNMAINFANLGNLDRAEQLYRAANAQFEQAGDLNNQITATGNIADILFLRGNLPAAERMYQEALKTSESVDNSEPGYLLFRLADLNLTRGQVPDARRFAQQAVDGLLPVHGAYQYLTGAMVSLGEAMEAQGDLAGARSQFERTLALRQQVGAMDLAAESQVELASLAIQEGQPDKAEPLLRSAIAEFEKEKSDPDDSSAYTLLSRALLVQGKLDDARKAAQQGAELSLTSSDPALRLPAQIQQARVEIATADHQGANAAAALRSLQSVIATAKRLGYYNLEGEARLVLGELELKTNSSLGQKRLATLASDAHSHGMELLAHQAEQAGSNPTILTQNHSAR